MDSLDDHHYTFIRVLLSCVGLWPYENTSFTYVKRASYLVVVVFAVILQVTQLLEMIREDWRQINNVYETRMLPKMAGERKSMGVILSAGIHGFIISYVVYTTSLHYVSNSTTTENDFMVYSRVKLVYTKNDEKYVLVSLMHTYIMVLLGLITLAGAEATTILCGRHAFGMIEIQRNDEMDVIVPKKDIATTEKVIDVVIVHRRMLRYRKEDESNLMEYFFLLVLAMASLRTNLLRFSYAILRFRRLLQILPTAAVIIGPFLYLGLMNHLGRRVIDNGAKFFTDTYTGIWYRATVPAQKLLLFIMCHSMKESEFMFGWMFRPSHEGLFTMTKFFVSYLTVTYSMDI